MRRRQLHFLVDLARVHVERAPEDEREAEHVVDHIRVIAAPGRHDHVLADGEGVLRHDLRVGVRQREDDRVFRHRRHHLRLEHARRRQAEEQVAAARGVRQRARVGIDGVAQLVRVHVLFAPGIDHAGAVHQNDIFLADAELDVKIGAGNGARARAGDDDVHVFELLAGDLDGVDQRRAGDDRRAVLVVVKDRDVEFFLEDALDFEAFRRFDVFQVDAAEGRRERADDRDHFLDRLGVDLDVEHVHVGEALEQDAFAFHDGLGGQRALVAQAEDRRAVGDHGDEVGFGGQFVSGERIARDFEHRFGDAGRVGEREIALGLQRLGRDDLDFAGASPAVIFKYILWCDCHDRYS